MRKDVIVACDFEGTAPFLDFLGRFAGEKPFIKVGIQLFITGGPQVVRRAVDLGHRVFFDTKLHDTPAQVRRAMRALAGLGVAMASVQAAGGGEMMRAALEGLDEGAAGTRPLLVAETLPTSVDQEMMNSELLIPGILGEVVAAYAAGAQAAGLDGAVCSPLEVGAVKDWCGPDFLTVTPGIRREADETDARRRCADAGEAARLGSDYIVVGRSVTQADDPVAAYRQVLARFAGS